MQDIIDITSELYNKLEHLTTKIGQKVFNVLDREGIPAIIADTKRGVFWFEYYTSGNGCPNYAYKWLKAFINREYGYKYLYDI